VNFAEQPPSKEWAALKYRGEKFAEVWFKPEGEPCALTFRIPQKTFQAPGMGPLLTPENLLKAVTIAPQEVESWRQGDVSHSGMNEPDSEIRTPLRPPPRDVPYLDVHVQLKPLAQALANNESGEKDSGGKETAEKEIAEKETGVADGVVAEVSSANWQDLEARWKAILGLEATVDTLRISVEGLKAELESSLKKTLTAEEKIHALRADLAQWSKEKSRVHHALPKLKEFIHRATWAIGAPERKQLEELYKNHIQPQIPFTQMDKVLAQLENMQKDRQVLSAHGTAVFHESKSIAGAVQGALRTLQSNAAAKAYQKRGASNAKGKFFKQIRRWSGAE
jgi:hypothetical protein